jgi:A/G-specific adenine glycosylase
LGLTDTLPNRKAKPNRKVRFLHYACIAGPKGILVKKRDEKNIWAHLYEFPLKEERTGQYFTPGQWEGMAKELLGMTAQFAGYHKQTTHLLTHQTLNLSMATLYTLDAVAPAPFIWVAPEDQDRLAFPKPLRKYLEEIPRPFVSAKPG